SDDVVVAVDDAELAIIEIRIVGGEHAGDVLRCVAQGQEVEREGIDVAQVIGLRLAHPDVGANAFVAPAAGHGKSRRADTKASACRAARDDGIGHRTSFSREASSFSTNSIAGTALRGLSARSS